jgi:hypothetical protein
MLTSTLRFPTPRSTNPFVRALRAAWTLPTNLVGHSLAGRPARAIETSTPQAWLYLVDERWASHLTASTLGHVIAACRLMPIRAGFAPMFCEELRAPTQP